MELATLLIATGFLLLIYLWFPRSHTHLPPFPTRPLPIIGNLLALKSDMRSLFVTWRRQFGDIFSLYMGGKYVVVLNGYDAIKEALVTNGDVCSDRPEYFYDVASGIPAKGVAFSSGSYWKEQRSVVLAILRTFGIGTNILAKKIMDEMTSFVDCLTSLKEKPTNIEVIIYTSVSNIICSILFGKRFKYDDEDFHKMVRAMRSLFSVQQSVSLVNFIPCLQYLPGDLFHAKKSATSVRTMSSILGMWVNKKKKGNVSDVTEIDNFIDAYTYEMNKQIKAGVTTSLDEDSLTKILYDLFIAGTETTSTTIYWCILYMIAYPNVQEKVYQEIKEKVGTDRAPTMQDKNQLTYISAVIHETQRLASIVPLSISHMCSEEVKVRGYTLPKGTLIIPNLDSALHDTATWGNDATSFRPERFIDANGKIKVPEQFIPFSVGPRVCMGEALARMELFLFLSSMFQRFQFLPTEINPPSIECVFGIVAYPKSFEVIIKERN